MHKRTITTIMAAFLAVTLSLGQKPAYTLFDTGGKEAKYKKLVKAATEANVVLFGELHNNPISHWLQYELTVDLYQEIGKDLVLGAEMFEADGQIIMDEYFAGLITQEKFEEEMRLWDNYKTDYKPLVEFARDSGLRFIATNIPRRYANSVYKMGLETLTGLSSLALTYMMPLPLSYDTTLVSYIALAGGGPMGGHGSPGLRDAQAVKDATMAHFILKNLEEDHTMIHFNGAYHSDVYEGIYYFLKNADPSLDILTISTVSQDNISELDAENTNKADYIIAIPESMTKTY
ncbi:MAG: ChaN family lipoprotein [Bacteroidales bacterium]|nr:ChaN family lipoprotein [Bacteroidales bacterium]